MNVLLATLLGFRQWEQHKKIKSSFLPSRHFPAPLSSPLLKQHIQKLDLRENRLFNKYQ